MKTKKAADTAVVDGKAHIPSFVDPLLLEGTHTRAEIMAEIRRLRPDFKDPSAAVSNRFRYLVQAGKHPGVKGAEPRAHGASRPGTALVEASRHQRREKRLARVQEWADKTSQEVSESFRRKAAYEAKWKSEPRPKKIWA